VTLNPFVTVAEAATIVGVSERTMRKWIRKGEVRHVKASDRRRFLYRADMLDLAVTRQERTTNG
jgi:excisionase family DNA binding protein